MGGRDPGRRSVPAREPRRAVARLIHGDIFGLERWYPGAPASTPPWSADYRKSQSRSTSSSEFAAMVGRPPQVPRGARAVRRRDADERPLRRPGRRQRPAAVRRDPDRAHGINSLEQRVVVQYACDGKTFALSVRDAYGSFERATLVRFLHKCLHSEQQIESQDGRRRPGPVPDGQRRRR